MNSVASGLESLASFNLHRLREEWPKYYRSEVPAAMSRELLQRAIGYKMQEKVLGGLTRRAQLRMSSLKSTSGEEKKSNAERATPILKSGTKLLREWQGKVHEVLTLDDGQFAYAGKTYRSLTMIAQQITGAHWSGPRFFGLKSARVLADG
jgi:hypothetical protein